MLGLLPWPPIPRTRARARRGRTSSSRGESQTPIQAGSGAFTIGFRLPGTGPTAADAIAWRLGHIIVGVLGVSVGNHFGGPPIDYQTFDYTGTAAAALERLDDAYDAWNRGVKAWTPTGSPARVGRARDRTPARPMATLVLHIIWEVIHHGDERLVPVALRPTGPARTAATSRGADARRPPVCDTRTIKRRARHWLADVVIGGIVGGIIGGVVAVNVVIYSGIEPGYQRASPRCSVRTRSSGS